MNLSMRAQNWGVMGGYSISPCRRYSAFSLYLSKNPLSLLFLIIEFPWAKNKNSVFFQYTPKSLFNGRVCAVRSLWYLSYAKRELEERAMPPRGRFRQNRMIDRGGRNEIRSMTLM